MGKKFRIRVNSRFGDWRFKAFIFGVALRDGMSFELQPQAGE
jgi:hypothetical protein